LVPPSGLPGIGFAFRFCDRISAAMEGSGGVGRRRLFIGPC
jgi:hypothetical protein